MARPSLRARARADRVARARIHAAIQREAWQARVGLALADVTPETFPTLAALGDAALRTWIENPHARRLAYAGKRYGLRLMNPDRLMVFDLTTGDDLVGVFVGFWL